MDNLWQLVQWLDASKVEVVGLEELMIQLRNRFGTPVEGAKIFATWTRDANSNWGITRTNWTGALPNFVGSSLRDVEHEAARLHVRLRARTAPGRTGTIVHQSPDPGVAIAPGLRVKLVVGDGSRT